MKKRKKPNNVSAQKALAVYKPNKIIYFDKETIKNILQEYNNGTIS